MCKPVLMKIDMKSGNHMQDCNTRSTKIAEHKCRVLLDFIRKKEYEYGHRSNKIFKITAKVKRHSIKNNINDIFVLKN